MAGRGEYLGIYFPFCVQAGRDNILAYTFKFVYGLGGGGNILAYIFYFVYRLGGVISWHILSILCMGWEGGIGWYILSILCTGCEGGIGWYILSILCMGWEGEYLGIYFLFCYRLGGGKRLAYTFYFV